MRPERVVPVRQRTVWSEVEALHLHVRNLDAQLVGTGVQRRLHAQAGLGARRANEVDHRFITHQGSPLPIQTDVREEPVLDLIPFAGASWIVTSSVRS